MKKVLLVQYTQAGQLSDVLSHLSAPLRSTQGIELTVLTLQPKAAYPFPWPIFRFFDTFPEAVYLDPPELEPLGLEAGARYDLIILGYQVWFLSPSLPVTALLKGSQAPALFKDTPVVTVIACRDMWLMAQEQMKTLLAALGAKLVGNVALVDEAGSLGSFLATPVWMMTGKRGPHLGGLIPRGGVAPDKIAASSRFGERIAQALAAGAPLDEGLLKGLGAVKVNDRLIASEKTARRSFLIWGRLLRSLGPQGHWARQAVLVVYIAFLVLMLASVVPTTMILKTLLRPFTRGRVARQVEYYGAPSGA